MWAFQKEKPTAERGCLLLQAETWLFWFTPLRADRAAVLLKPPVAVGQTEGFVVQAGQHGSFAHIHQGFMCGPSCLVCSESLCWWVSVLQQHSIVLLPLVWMSFWSQTSRVSATQICCNICFISWLILGLFFYWINVGCSLKQHKWEQFRSLFHETSWCGFTSTYLSLAPLFL